MITTKQTVSIGASPGSIALVMRRPASIAAFPGIDSATPGSPGYRLDVEVAPLGFTMRDRVWLAWGLPHHSDDAVQYPFTIEGGRWLTGAGSARIARRAHNVSDVTISWELDPPRLLLAIPAMKPAMRRCLRLATRRWLREVRVAAERPSAARSLTLADVGA